MFVMVQRAFTANGRQFRSGDGPIDASGWRLLPKLVAQRYVRIVDPATVPVAAGGDDTAEQGASAGPSTPQPKKPK